MSQPIGSIVFGPSGSPDLSIMPSPLQLECERLRAENAAAWDRCEEYRKLIKDVAIPALSCCTHGGELYAAIPALVSLAANKDLSQIEKAITKLKEAVK